MNDKAKQILKFLVLAPAFSSRNLTSLGLVAIFFLVYYFAGGKMSTMPRVRPDGSFGGSLITNEGRNNLQPSDQGRLAPSARGTLQSDPEQGNKARTVLGSEQYGSPGSSNSAGMPIREGYGVGREIPVRDPNGVTAPSMPVAPTVPAPTVPMGEPSPGPGQPSAVSKRLSDLEARLKGLKSSSVNSGAATGAAGASGNGAR